MKCTVFPPILSVFYSRVPVFNVGEYRRRIVGAKKSYDFYHPDNQDAQLARK